MKHLIRGWLMGGGALALIVCACSPSDQPDATSHDVADLLVGNSGSSGVEGYVLSTGDSLGDFIPPGSGGLIFPDAITTGPDGVVYVSSGCRTTADSVCNKSLSAILRYDGQTGAFLDTLASGAEPGSPLYRPYGTAFGPEGLLYVASLMTNQILRYDTAGALIDVFASGDGLDSLGLNGPNGLAFDDDGRFLYVTTEGDSLVCPGAPMEGHCKPVFTGGYPSLVLRYEVATGEKTVFARPPMADSTAPSLAGIDFGPDGRLYVSDFSVNVVRVYDPATGVQEQLLPTVDSTMCDSTISNPYTGDLTFDASGALLVTVGGQNDGDPGAVVRYWGEGYANNECLVGPTTQLDRPVGIDVHQ